MKYLSVKAYTELVGKSGKTVYKQIKNGDIEARMNKGKYEVRVDPNILKVFDGMQKALEEANKALSSLEQTVVKAPTKSKTKAAKKKIVLKKSSAKPAVKKSVTKKTVKNAASKKSVQKKSIAKKKKMIARR